MTNALKRDVVELQVVLSPGLSPERPQVRQLSRWRASWAGPKLLASIRVLSGHSLPIASPRGLHLPPSPRLPAQGTGLFPRPLPFLISRSPHTHHSCPLGPSALMSQFGSSGATQNLLGRECSSPPALVNTDFISAWRAEAACSEAGGKILPWGSSSSDLEPPTPLASGSSQLPFPKTCAHLSVRGSLSPGFLTL